VSAACSDLPTSNDSAPVAQAQLLTILPATQCPAGTIGTQGLLDDGKSLYEFCLPAPPALPLGLVLYAHGYSQPGTPLSIVDNQIPVGDGSTLRVSEVVTSLHLGFGTTSYPHVGLNGPEGVASLHSLKQAFTTIYGAQAAALPTYLVGVSEGGFIAALAAEQPTSDFQGVLAACGPVGDFRRQLDYLGDFRVLFDYFFPGVLGPAWTDNGDYGAAARAQVAANWDFYQAQIIAALRTRPLAAAQLIATSRAPVNPLDLNSIGETVIAVLWYNIFSTDDAVQRLGGRPYDNRGRFFTGSFSDFLLNARVKRFAAEATALATIQSGFTTTGALRMPVVTDHTLLDPAVPARQEIVYAGKVALAGQSARLRQFVVPRYGHCAFTVGELEQAFGQLVQQTAGPALAISGVTTAQPGLHFGAFADLGKPMR
jgi:hypothetical protein